MKMKKILFGIALIMFGFSIYFIERYAIIELLSLVIVFVGLAFSIYGFVEKEK